MGQKTRSVDADLKKLGNTPLGQKAAESLESLQATMKGIADAQQRLADRATLAARGLDAIGGPAKLTRSELEQMNRTIQKGLDALNALGDTGSADLKKLESSAASVQKQLKSLQQVQPAPGGGLGASLSGALGGLPGGSTLSAFASGGVSAGLAAGLGAAAAAFGVAAKAALDYADSLTKISDQTGIGTEALQHIENVAAASGNSLEEVASAISQFQKRFASGDAGTVQAIREIGLSINQLNALKPDEQFFAIAKGIQSIQDPAEQTRVAMELFGKSGAQLLPTLKADVDTLKDATITMSADAVAALDDLGDSFGNLAKSAKAVAGEGLALLLNALQPQRRVFKEAAEEAKNFADELQRMLNVVGHAGDRGDIQLSVPNTLGRSLDDLLGELSGGAAEQMAKFKADEALASFRKEVSALTSELSGDKAAHALKVLTEAWREQPDAVKQNVLSIDRVLAAYKPLAEQLDRSQLPKDLEALRQEFVTSVDAMAANRDATLATQKQIGQLELGYVKAAQAAGLLRKATLALTEEQAADFDPTRDTLPSVDALGAGKTRKAPLTSKDFKDRNDGGVKPGADQATQSFSDFLRDDLGKSILSVFQGGGSLSRTLGGTLGGFFTSATSDAGKTIAGGLTSTLGKTLGGALGSVLPGLGTLAGGLVGDFFGKLFNNPEKQINPLRQAFVDAAGGLADLNARAADAGVTLTALLDAKNPEQYQKAIESLNAAFKFQDDAMATLDETAQKYGFTLAELPEQFRQGKLDEQFLELFKDQQVLVAGGFDLDAVLQKQVGSFNDLIHVALDTGATIPEQMKPAIQKLIDMGLATDSAGDKLTDIGKLTFAETLDQKFGTLIETIDKLVQAITRGLGGAIQNIPQPGPIHVPVVIDFPNRGDIEVPEGAATGGRVTAHGIQHFAGGGVVLPFFRPRGTDTVPAMLTPGEMVLTEGQQAQVSAALKGQGGASVNLAGMHRRLDDLNQNIASLMRRQPDDIARAVRDVQRKVVRR